MNPEHEAVTQDAPSEILSPGAQLQAARERAGWTAERLAAELGLPPERMHALERDEHDCFGGIVFVRGYLRRAAVLLGVPAEDLIAAYEACCNTTKPAEMVPGLPPGRLPGRGLSGWTGPAVGAVAFVAVAAATWWLAERGDQGVPVVEQAARSQPAGLEFNLPREPEALPGETSAPTAAGGSEREAAGEADETGLDRLADTPRETPGSETFSSSTLSATPGATPGATPEATPAPSSAPVAAPAPTVVAVVPEPAILPPGMVELRLEFIEDCWLEVTDADGRRLAYRLYNAGDIARLQGKAPATVFLGNAEGVRMTVDETPIPVRPARRDGTARLTVGGGAG